MRLRFRSAALERLETEDSQAYAEAVTARYRHRLNFIRQAPDERDFRAMKSLHFEQLKGNRSHQHSMRLNQQFRLILEFSGAGVERIIDVVGIEDYH